MKYAYGSKKFIKTIRKLYGKVSVLKDLTDVFKIPRGSILYVDLPLRVAAKIKLKAPWITVRTWAVEIEDVELLQLDAYGLIYDIAKHGTCVVYVPDATVRRALKSFPTYAKLPISFEESCQPTYPCSYLDWTRSFEEFIYNTFYYERPASIEPRGRYIIPTSTTTYMLPEMSEVKWTEDKCTAIGTPYFSVDWDYYIDYPLGLLPEELAEQLKDGRLKFQKAVPKLKTY
jgi:hypothetical protein